MTNPSDITYFAETDFRNQKIRFGVKQADRTKHVYVIGKTGMGKSTLLRNMAIQDVQSGLGMAFLDPHGNLVEELLDYVPEDRLDDVLYFAPFDLSHPIAFNILEDVGYDKRHLVANGLMSVFKKIWVDAWSARMEYILNNSILALLEYPDATLLGINRMLSDKVYRNRVVANISDVAVRSFWLDEFAQYSERYMVEAVASIQNKVGQFLSNPLIRNIVGQPRSSFDVRDFIDNKKIILLNLSKGRIGADNTNLLGSMLITKIYLAAMSRADISYAELDRLPNFYFYVDEFQSFANESFADILSEARKYKLNLTIAHQYIEQMSDEVRAAVFGNVGTMITFRVGATDAEALEKEFAPVFQAQDMVNLGFAQIYLRLMIDGVGSKPFSARTLAPLPFSERSFSDEVIRRSREQFATNRQEVEQQFINWRESHSGLINDPVILQRREKEREQKNIQIEAYKESRDQLGESDSEAVAPRPPQSSNSVNKKKPLGPGQQKQNQKSQRAPRSKKEAKNPSSQTTITAAEEKKAGTQESLSELRETLSSVLKKSGMEVNSDKASSEKKKTQDRATKKNNNRQKPKKSPREENNQKQNSVSSSSPKKELKKESKQNLETGKSTENNSAQAASQFELSEEELKKILQI